MIRRTVCNSGSSSLASGMGQDYHEEIMETDLNSVAC